MTEEEARGNIIFDDDYLCPMTTVVPDDWFLSTVVRKWAQNDELHEYEVWYAPGAYVVMCWKYILDIGYEYPTVQVFSDREQADKFIGSTKNWQYKYTACTDK